MAGDAAGHGIASVTLEYFLLVQLLFENGAAAHWEKPNEGGITPHSFAADSFPAYILKKLELYHAEVMGLPAPVHQSALLDPIKAAKAAACPNSSPLLSRPVLSSELCCPLPSLPRLLSCTWSSSLRAP